MSSLLSYHLILISIHLFFFSILIRFILALRSAVAMFIPMAEHQALLFETDGPIAQRVFGSNSSNDIYGLLRSKLEEHKK